jgi:uncharacterized membrane protein YdjX (TVP38/TMEM64 family)
MKKIKEFIKDNSLILYILIISVLVTSSALIFNIYYDYSTIIEQTKNFSETYKINIVLFSILFIILSLLGVSIIILSIISGILFHFINALIISIVSVNIASFIAFYISRHLSKRLENKNIKIKIFEKYKNRIKNNINYNNIKSLIAIKFIIPAIPFSYGAGFLKKLSIKNFTYATLIQNTFIVIIFTYFGFSTAKNIIFYISSIILILIIIFINYKIYKKNKK